MIWQLLKRDATWVRPTAVAAVFFAFLAALSEFLPGIWGQLSAADLRAEFAGFAAMTVWILVVIHFMVQSKHELHEAALPIAGRDAWFSRVLSLLAIVWLPLSISIALGFPRQPLLQLAAIYTLLVMGMRVFGVPQRLRALGLVVPIFALPFFFSLTLHRHSPSWLVLPPTGTVLTICGVASTALFAWGWATVPKSFQIVPPKSGLVPQRETKKPSAFSLSPLFRSIYGRATVTRLILLFLFGNIMAGNPGVAAMLIGIIGLQQVDIRIRCRWLLALPMSPRRLFAWIALPQAAVIVVGGLAAIFIDTEHPLSPQARVITMAVEIAALYGLIFLSELPAWRRLSKLHVTRWGALVLWVPLLAGGAALVLALPDTQTSRWLADRPPGLLSQLAAIIAVPAMYWLAEKAFREQEYRK